MLFIKSQCTCSCKKDCCWLFITLSHTVEFPWVLMIYEINHIWTAEIKWKWRNNRCSERNLCNCIKKPEKKNQDFNVRGLNLWPHDTGAMFYQLSYEATDVGSRSILHSYAPVKEISVNDIWNNNWPAPNISGFIAQLVEHRTSIARSRVQTPLNSWIFFQASLRNCIKCVHCDDHFFTFRIPLI